MPPLIDVIPAPAKPSELSITILHQTVAPTDFIFSVIAEEWGLVGITIFFITYGLLIWRILHIAIKAESNFPRLFAVGFAIVLITQFTVNIGMNLSLLPVVGIYLPFVSYGGSGLVANFISLGILQSIYIRK